MAIEVPIYRTKSSNIYQLIDYATRKKKHIHRLEK